MSNAKPMGAQRRASAYTRQSGKTLTPAQNRRFSKKLNREIKENDKELKNL